MKYRFYSTASVLAAIACMNTGSATAQNGQGGSASLLEAGVETTYIQCGALFDSRTKSLRRNILVKIQGKTIADMRDYSPGDLPTAGAKVINLSHETCLPGMIDTHVHLFLQGDLKPGQIDQQLLKLSVPYRAFWATQAARRMLGYGFTTVRDLGTIGAGYADVDIRRAIAEGVIPGPRVLAAGRTIAATGASPFADVMPGIELHTAEEASGPDEIRKAVRSQIASGADCIKLFGDHGLQGVPSFTSDELRAAVDEAHVQGRKISCHTIGPKGAHSAIQAGVDSIEHGVQVDEHDLKSMAEHGIFLVPTLYVASYAAEVSDSGRREIWQGVAKTQARTFRQALANHVRIAFGTDAGAFEWTVNPAKEFSKMVEYGMASEEAIQAATLNAAELLGMQQQIGVLEPGKLADIVAVTGDPAADVKLLQLVNFVMKEGEVYQGENAHR